MISKYAIFLNAKYVIHSKYAQSYWNFMDEYDAVIMMVNSLL